MKLSNPSFLIPAAAFAILAVLPTGASAAVTQFTFLNGMSGANEVPANSSTGTATINVLSFDSSVGSFGTLTVNLSFSGLSGNATASHVHGFSNSTTNSSVQATLTVTPSTSGTITGSWSPASSAQVTDLFNGLTYVNLHSTVFPGGELRGQIVPVPEPTSLVLTMLAGGVMMTRRRRTA